MSREHNINDMPRRPLPPFREPTIEEIRAHSALVNADEERYVRARAEIYRARGNNLRLVEFNNSLGPIVSEEHNDIRNIYYGIYLDDLCDCCDIMKFEEMTGARTCRGIMECPSNAEYVNLLIVIRRRVSENLSTYL